MKITNASFFLFFFPPGTTVQKSRRPFTGTKILCIQPCACKGYWKPEWLGQKQIK